MYHLHFICAVQIVWFDCSAENVGRTQFRQDEYGTGTIAYYLH